MLKLSDNLTFEQLSVQVKLICSSLRCEKSYQPVFSFEQISNLLNELFIQNVRLLLMFFLYFSFHNAIKLYYVPVRGDFRLLFNGLLLFKIDG